MERVASQPRAAVPQAQRRKRFLISLRGTVSEPLEPARSPKVGRSGSRRGSSLLLGSLAVSPIDVAGIGAPEHPADPASSNEADGCPASVRALF
jgi:hypothetical protein